MSDFTEKNPEAMKKFLRAIIRAERFIVSDPEESLEIIAGYTGSAKESVREFVALMRLRVTLDQAFLLVLENVSRWMQSSGNPAVYGKYNFLDFVYSEAMESVAPERMRIIK